MIESVIIGSALKMYGRCHDWSIDDLFNPKTTLDAVTLYNEIAKLEKQSKKEVAALEKITKRLNQRIKQENFSKEFMRNTQILTTLN